MQFTHPAKAAVFAALLTLAPAAALAQDEANNMAADTQYVATEEEDDDFPWGLLGLLGLAGLAGLKKRESDIHVDARRNP